MTLTTAIMYIADYDEVPHLSYPWRQQRMW